MADMRADNVRASAARRVAWALLAAFALTAAFALVPGPMAARVAYAAPSGSLTLACATGNGQALEGDTWSLVRVADAELDASGTAVASYEMRGAFAGFAYRWDRMDSSEVADAARELAEFAGTNGLYETSGLADAGGRVAFYGLVPGLYLLERTDIAEGNEASACDPLLVAVPLAEGEALVYDVTAYPKFESGEQPPAQTPPAGEEPPAETTEPPSEWTDGALSQTGDYVMTIVGTLLVMGGIALASGRALRPKACAAGDAATGDGAGAEDAAEGAQGAADGAAEDGDALAPAAAPDEGDPVADTGADDPTAADDKSAVDPAAAGDSDSPACEGDASTDAADERADDELIEDDGASGDDAPVSDDAPDSETKAPADSSDR